jgi:sulfonate transport system ATP-binding protein
LKTPSKKPAIAMAAASPGGASPDVQKFFGSFFQKRTATLSESTAQRVGIMPAIGTLMRPRSAERAAAFTAPPAPRQGLDISLRGVGKAFGNRPVLRDIDLDILPGQFVAIVGRSGSGKSTLLRLLAGLEQPDQGSVLLGGRSPSQAAGALRIMFQDGRLLPWRTVIANVSLGLPQAVRARACHALASVGLADRAGDWPRVLSGGQKQRVALARALAAEPGLILLDEPLGALDALTRLEMQGLIEDLWRRIGFSAVLVTHDVAEAALLADRILLIEDGGIALDLTVDIQRPRRPGVEVAAVEQKILAHLLKG